MKPLGLSGYLMAKAIGATPIAISEIIRRKRAVSAEIAPRAWAQLYNVSPELWMGIQADYDLEIARDRSEAPDFPPGASAQAARACGGLNAAAP